MWNDQKGHTLLLEIKKGRTAGLVSHNQIPSLQPNNSIPRDLPEGEKNISLQIGFYKNSHNSFIQKRPKLETITSINMNMNKPWDTTQL